MTVEQCQGIAALAAWMGKNRRRTYLRRNLRSVLRASRPESRRRCALNKLQSNAAVKEDRPKLENLIVIESNLALKIEIGPIRGMFPAAISTHSNAENFTYKSLCTVNIFQREKRANIPGKLVPWDERLDGATQECEIEVARSDPGLARVSLPQPFIFKEESLLVDVPSKIYTGSPSMSVVSGLAEKYVVVVKFDKPRGPVSMWPPLGLASTVSGKVQQLISGKNWSTNKIVLQSTITEILKPYSGSGLPSVDIALSLASEKQRTGLTLDYDIEWSASPHLKSSRSIKRHVLAPQPNLENSPITYKFTFETGEARSIILDTLACVLCRCSHESMEELLFHLVTSHDELRFEHKADAILVKEGNGRGNAKKYRQTHVNDVFRLNPPLKKFNLQAWLDGDISWAADRSKDTRGLYANRRFPAFEYEDYDLSSPEKFVSKSVSPQKILPPEPFSVPEPEKYHIETQDDGEYAFEFRDAGPFYDTLTKQLLKPGNPLSTPRADEGWLLKKHNDTLNDYSDVTMAEKEFLTRWDAFILPQKLTASCYMADALERFVKQEPEWFVGNEERLAELGKLCTLFLIRRVVDLPCVRRVLEIASREAVEKAMEGADGVDIMDID